MLQWKIFRGWRCTNLLGLGVLVLLPVGELFLELLDHGRDVALLHGRVDVDAAEVLDGADVKLELALGGGRGGAAVGALVLLAASAGHEVLVVVLLALDHGALELLGLDLAGSGSGELAGAGGLGLSD